MEEKELREILKRDYNEEEIEKIIEGFQKKRYVSLRVNTLKGTKAEVEQVLDDNAVLYREVKWYPDALVILNKDEAFIEGLDIYKEGKIYLQSLSSMIPVIVLAPKEFENILDMAAAPGGKTTQIGALTQNRCMITAVEKNKIRAERLQYNISKLGLKRVTILKKDARYLDENFVFDKILLDAPCSGSGTLKINNEVVENEFSNDLIERSIKTQEELWRKAYKLLKVRGEMVYSTCSILAQENYELVLKLQKELGFEVVELDKELIDGLGKSGAVIDYHQNRGLVIMPNEFYEGFFVVKIRKVK